MKAFTEEDSVIIFDLSETCKIICYGYAKNEEKEVFVIGWYLQTPSLTGSFYEKTALLSFFNYIKCEYSKIQYRCTTRRVSN